jgi:exosortase F-associated protein
MEIIKKIINILILIICLLLIKKFENVIFYDPLINFFKIKQILTNLPYIKIWHYIFNNIIRFIINSFLSVCIQYQLIHKKSYVYISLILFCMFFILVYPIHLFLIYQNMTHVHARTLLYLTRKCISEPILLIIIFPIVLLQYIQ